MHFEIEPFTIENILLSLTSGKNINTSRDVQDSSDAEIRHEIYRISSPAWDSDSGNEKRAVGSTGIEPGPPAWQSDILPFL